jgi:WD40 repeat protein
MRTSRPKFALVPAIAILCLVPLTGGPATVVAQEAIRQYQVAWSPDGTRLAYLSGGDLHVFDHASGDSRRITSRAGYRFGIPRWSADGSEIILGGDLIDLATGNVVASLVPPGQVIDSTLSPDGRYFVATEPCEGYPPPHRIHLYDKKTGETRLLRDCDEAVSAHLRWLPDGHHLLVKEPSCYACETVAFSITSMDVESGDVVALTDGLEPHAAAYVSPGGSRVLVTGKALRLYTEDGLLLRALPAPEDFDVAAAAWSPDGSSFVYIVGPAGFFLL